MPTTERIGATSLSSELTPLLELSARVGNNPLLTQASTGNTSMKLNGVLWIKASGKWMADACNDDILIPLDLASVLECLRQNVDPAKRFARASIETSMHSLLPRRVVLHLHSVNTIAWAVRQDAQVRLQQLLDGLRWRWIPYVPSGLALAREIESIPAPGSDILVLGNHGLVLAADDCASVERLLDEVERRLASPAGALIQPTTTCWRASLQTPSGSYLTMMTCMRLAPMPSRAPSSREVCSSHARQFFPTPAPRRYSERCAFAIPWRSGLASMRVVPF